MNREGVVTRLGRVARLKKWREEILQAFQSLETRGTFERKTWNYQKGSGGGEMAVLRGEVFEKVAVNFSAVESDTGPAASVSFLSRGLDKKESSASPVSDLKSPFFATGVSLITHMRNPKAPTVHMNLRYIESGEKKWLGGGFDLTPMGFPFEEDTKHFHSVAKKILDPFGADLYEKFSAWAKEYFTIQHYGCERGVGGIFFDDQPIDFYPTWCAVGEGFLETILPIYKRRISEKYTEADRQTQLKARSRYVEFNLLYDRGTKFGFQSGGNPEAILCSMPPLATW